jgi:hypothetical protein
MVEITVQEKMRRRQSIDSVLGSHAMSGLFPDAETLALMQRYTEGEFTLEEWSAAMDAHANDLVVRMGYTLPPSDEINTQTDS